MLRDFSSPALYLIQNIILAATAFYALRAIRENRENTNRQIENQEYIAQKRATLDLILNMTSDVFYNEARSIVIKMRNDKNDPAQLRSKMKDPSLSVDERKVALHQHRACQTVLNKLALFASGIENGVLDEETFKAYYYSSFIIFVEFLRGYILDLRRNVSVEITEKSYVSHETIYQENIWLLSRWKADPLLKRGHGSI